MAFTQTLRRLGAIVALALMVGSLGAIAAPAFAQHDDEEAVHAEAGRESEGAIEGERDAEAEHAEEEEPQIAWFTAGPDGEPAFAGRLIAFAIWLGILVYFGRAPIAAFLSTRRSAIVAGLEEAQRLEAAAKAKHDEYSERIENLDHEIAKLRADFERAGMEERDRMVAEASARANKMLEEAKFLVEQQTKQLREELTRESIDAAVAAAEKILRERATGADQQRLADEYLAKLRASVAASTAKTGPAAPATPAPGAS